MGKPNPNPNASNAPSAGNESPRYVHEGRPSPMPPAPAQYPPPPPPTASEYAPHRPAAYPPPQPFPPPAAGDEEDEMRTSAVDATDQTPTMGFPTVNPETYPPQPAAYPPPSHPPPPPPRPVAYPPPPSPDPAAASPAQFAQYSPAVGTQATPLRGNPAIMSPYRPVGKPWASSLYDFDLNSTNAVMTAFFPCVTFGQIAEILDEGQTTCTAGSIMYLLLMPVLACSILGNIYRKKLRMKYNLVEAPAEDCILHLFCPCCSLCQEYRELEAKGIDPSLGWLGNIALQQDMIKSAPAVQTMNR